MFFLAEAAGARVAYAATAVVAVLDDFARCAIVALAHLTCSNLRFTVVTKAGLTTVALKHDITVAVAAK